jgi:hypothetical protein
MGEPLLSELDYFADAELVQHTLRHAFIEKLRYEGKLDRGHPDDRVEDLKFEIKGQANFVALHDTVLWVKCKITKSNGAACNHVSSSTNTSPDVVAPVNNLLHSMFSKVEVKINGNTAETVDNYPYRAYVETLLSYDDDVLRTRAALQGWSKDTHSAMEATTGTDNRGLAARSEMFQNSKEVWLCGRLHSSLFAQGRCIPPNTQVELSLIGSKDKYVLMVPKPANAEAHPYRLHITDAYLEVMRHFVEPSVLDAQLLMRTQGTRIPLQHRDIKISSETLSTGMTEVTDNGGLFPQFRSQLPDRVFIFFAQSGSVDGSYQRNPLKFTHADVGKISITVNADLPRTIECETSFASEESCKNAYYRLLREFGAHIGARKFGISLQEYHNGFTVFPFRIVPRINDGDVLGPVEHGTLTINVKLRSDLKEPTKIFALSEYRSEYLISETGTSV